MVSIANEAVYLVRYNEKQTKNLPCWEEESGVWDYFFGIALTMR